jgi:MFS transporter, PHS family, inorganic phosphate transporter
MLGMLFWQESNHGQIPHNADTWIKVATSIGTVFGQAVFGYLADYLGRKRMYGIELLIIISATLGQSLCAPSTALSFVGVLVFWRVAMGIGIGGDYPLSAVITAEFATTKWRGAMVASVFAMQGLGQFAAALMALIVTSAFKDSLEGVTKVSDCHGQCLVAVDIMWRIIIGFGGIPGWFALYYRLTIPETPRYTFDVLQDVEKAASDTRQFRSGKLGEAPLNQLNHARMKVEMKKYRKPKPTPWEALQFFTRWRNALKLFGTAGSWFFLDIAFYGLGLNSGTILSTIGYAAKGNVYLTLHNTAVGQLILVCAGAIPGYWVTVATVDILGRKTIQIMGFTILTILFAVIGFHFNHLSQTSLLVLYVFSQFFFNFGKSPVPSVKYIAAWDLTKFWQDPMRRHS